VTPPGAVVVPNVVVGIEAGIRFHAPTSTEGIGHPLSQARKILAPPKAKISGYDRFRTRPPVPVGPE
jgi:hypothetical protein